jgi:hypothetical protein
MRFRFQARRPIARRAPSGIVGNSLRSSSSIATIWKFERALNGLVDSGHSLIALLLTHTLSAS